jgi:hypothetical protein
MTATKTEGSVVLGNSYYTFRWVKIGFDYEATGSLGADVYIRNVKFYENEENLTYEKNFSLKENGDLVVDNISEIGVTEGMIAHYPLNGDLLDYSGSGLSCSQVGTSIQAGLLQKCYSFDNTSGDYIRGNCLLPVRSWTISIWLLKRANSAGDYNIFWSFSLPYLSDYNGNHGQIRLSFIDTSGNQNNLGFSQNLITTGNWHNIVATSSEDGIRLYLNGVYLGKSSAVEGDTGDGVFELGRHKYSDNYRTDCKLQDFRIYNRPLSPEEVLINYDMTRPDGPKMKIGSNGTTYVRQIKEI